MWSNRSRSTWYYLPRQRDDSSLLQRVEEIAATRKHYGFWRIFVLLRRGWFDGQPQARLPAVLPGRRSTCGDSAHMIKQSGSDGAPRVRMVRRPNKDEAEYYSEMEGRVTIRPRASLPAETHEYCAGVLSRLIRSRRLQDLRVTLEVVQSRLSEWFSLEHPRRANPYGSTPDEAGAVTFPEELDLLRYTLLDGYPAGWARDRLDSIIAGAIARLNS